MALIKCSECGKEISDKAAACVHCGCPVPKLNMDQLQLDMGELFGGQFSGFGEAKTRTVKTANEPKSTNDVNATARTSGFDSLTGMIIALVLGVVCLVVESDLYLMLLGTIPVSLKTVGAVFLAVGLIIGIGILAKKKK